MCAPTARAAIVEFDIDTSLSVLTQSFNLTIPILGLGGPAGDTVPQVVSTTNYPALNSGQAPLYGSLFVDITAGGAAFQIVPGGGINHHITGSYSPFDPVTSDPVAGPGVTPGNYGLVVPAVGLFSVNYGMKSTLSMPGAGPSAGVNLVGLVMPLVEGWQAQYNGLSGGSSGSIAGFASILGSNGGAIATLIGNTLTIPVNSKLAVPITGSFPGTLTTYVSGNIVLHPRVPEPSSFVLLGFGVVGLIAAARRARRSK